jgi:23S rRNA (guanosine2251-2'-O)-methyltransferase
LNDCAKSGIAVRFISYDALTKMVASDSHQSFVAYIEERKFYEVKEFIDIYQNLPSFVLMLDQIFDPQNFGALLRAAECFGINGVVWSKNRGVHLTPLVAKASCGASELLQLLSISNLADAVERFKAADYEIIAALADSKAESLEQVRYGEKTVLIVGSEGEGIQPLLCKKADRHVFIPLVGKIESLNVAQATSILLSWRFLSNRPK